MLMFYFYDVFKIKCSHMGITGQTTSFHSNSLFTLKSETSYKFKPFLFLSTWKKL